MEILPAFIEDGFQALPSEMLQLTVGVRIKSLTRRRLAANRKEDLDLCINLIPDRLYLHPVYECVAQFTGEMAGALGQLFRRDFRIDPATSDGAIVARHHDERAALIVL